LGSQKVADRFYAALKAFLSPEAWGGVLSSSFRRWTSSRSIILDADGDSRASEPFFRPLWAYGVSFGEAHAG
jgi:hypothetical protein